jgi:hypothetical protein
MFLDDVEGPLDALVGLAHDRPMMGQARIDEQERRSHEAEHHHGAKGPDEARIRLRSRNSHPRSPHAQSRSGS